MDSSTLQDPSKNLQEYQIWAKPVNICRMDNYFNEAAYKKLQRFT